MDKPAKPSERDAFKLIEDMLQLMESRGLAELEVEQEGLRIRLKKAVPGGFVHAGQQGTFIPQSAAPAAAAPASKPEPEPRKGQQIKSPMVGTFYRAPAPDAPTFVEVGQRIEVGQVVCIIEAMKLMNEIKSEVAGRLTEILCQNGDPVEFGQALFTVDPSA